MSGGELHSNLGRTRGGPVSQPGLIIAPNTLPMWATWNNCNYYYCRLATTTKATENGRTLPGDSIEFIQIRMTQFAHCDMDGGWWCRWMDVPTFSLAPYLCTLGVGRFKRRCPPSIQPPAIKCLIVTQSPLCPPVPPERDTHDECTLLLRRNITDVCLIIHCSNNYDDVTILLPSPTHLGINLALWLHFK